MKRKQSAETEAARAFRESRARRVQGAIQDLDQIQKRREHELLAKVAGQDAGPRNGTTPVGFGYWAELAAARGMQDRVVVGEAAEDNGLDKEAGNHMEPEPDSPDDLTSISEDEGEPAHDSTGSDSGVDNPTLDLLDALEAYLHDNAAGDSGD